MDRWYPIRRQDDLGCFIQVGDVEMYVERGHYICRDGQRGSDRRRQAGLGEGVIPMDASRAVEGLARGA